MGKRGLTTILATVLLGGVLILGVFGFPKTAKGEDDPWTKFSKELATVSQGSITFKLDNEKKSGWTVYYHESKYTMHGDDKMTEEGYHRLEESPEWPGTYIVDLKKADQGILPSGLFYIYENEPEGPMEYIASFWASELDFSKGELPNMKTVDFYTISFKQGDVEGMEIPLSHIQKKGKFKDELIKMPHNYPGYILHEGYGHSRYMEAGGYAFSCWKDQKGREMTYNTEVDEPLTLTPVFVNEDDDDKNNAYYYQNWNDNGKEPVSVTTAEGLLHELADGESRFVTIDGNITLNPDTCGRKQVYAYTYGMENDEDFIIIHDGSSLTIDNLELECSVNWDLCEVNNGSVVPITVQSGGKLVLKNKGDIDYGYVAVQKGGTVTVDSLSHLECVSFFNHGRVEIIPAGDQGNNDIYGNLKSYSIFFNSKDGVIDNKGGEIRLDLDYNKWRCSSEYPYDLDGKKVYNDIGDMAQVRMRNNGKLTISGKSFLDIEPNSNSVYQHDRGAQMPFINNGELILSSDASGFYEKYNCRLEYGWLENNGTIDIKKPYGLYPYNSSFSSQQGGGIKAYEAMITNNGKISIDMAGGTGIYLAELFYDPTGTLGYDKGNVSYKEKQKGRLINSDGAEISISTGKDSVGLFIGDETYLENKGTITMGFADGADKTRNVSLALFHGYNDDDAEVYNPGTITNNGFIGHNRNDKAIKWEGNKWTGSGSEGLMAEGENNGGNNEENNGEQGGGQNGGQDAVTASDNKPMNKTEETREEGGVEIKAVYWSAVPFWGKSKIDPSYFGGMTVTAEGTEYKVKKIKVTNKKTKKYIQITGLEGAPKKLVKAVKKATKGKKGLPYTVNKYYVKDGDDVKAPIKKNKVKSVKIKIGTKYYKAKKGKEWTVDDANTVITFQGDNLAGSWRIR